MKIKEANLFNTVGCCIKKKGALSIKTAFNLVKIHLLSRIIPLIR
jgi:hypothetical protein